MFHRMITIALANLLLPSIENLDPGSIGVAGETIFRLVLLKRGLQDCRWTARISTVFGQSYMESRMFVQNVSEDGS